MNDSFFFFSEAKVAHDLIAPPTTLSTPLIIFMGSNRFLNVWVHGMVHLYLK